jgi:hypothetical protein
MFDPRRAGMAKSFFMQGGAAGYDMTDKAQINQFMLAHNAAQMAQVELRDKAKRDESKEKKKRKAEKAARKRHRKK